MISSVSLQLYPRSGQKRATNWWGVHWILPRTTTGGMFHNHLSVTAYPPVLELTSIKMAGTGKLSGYFQY